MILLGNNLKLCKSIIRKRHLGYVMLKRALSVRPVTLSFDKYDMHSNFSNAQHTPPPVIILHGLFGSKQNWRSLSKALNKNLPENNTIFAVDARNHGQSSHSSEHSYEHMTADLLGFCEQLNINKAIFMGHSMGGRSMMHFALKYPNVVEKAIIVDISPISTPTNLNEMKTMMTEMKKIIIPGNLSVREGRILASSMLNDVIPDAATKDFILLNLQKNDDSFSWRMNIESLLNNFEEISQFPNDSLNRQYSGPTLFIGGSDSNYIKKTDFPEIKKNFPLAELAYIQGAGHLVHVQKPLQFLELVISFI